MALIVSVKLTKENALIDRLPVNQKLCIIRSVIQTLLLRKFQPAKKWSPTGPTYGKKANFNNNTLWIELLQNEYCSNLIQDNNCSITTAMLEKAITRLQDNKSPGNDLIFAYWYKHLKFYANTLEQHIQWQQKRKQYYCQRRMTHIILKTIAQ